MLLGNHWHTTRNTCIRSTGVESHLLSSGWGMRKRWARRSRSLQPSKGPTRRWGVRMTYEKARRRLVISSLILLAGYGAILIAAPAFGYPLSYDESTQLLQTVFPLFL